jgi:FAD/FMN-containing dehydrogenase
MPDPSFTALARELADTIHGEVRFDIGSRALYATDGSNYRQVPIGVVVPRTIDDVIATVAVCRRHGAPVLPRGGGTSLCGQCCNVAVVIDFSKYLNRIVDLDARRQVAYVEPGCVLDTLRDAAEKHHLTFAPDPSTHTHNTLGGMIGNDSCGVHSVMGGKTVDNVFELDVLTYEGVRFTAQKLDDDERTRVLAYCRKGAAVLRAQRFADAPVRVIVDERDERGGEKVWQWVRKGVPLRLEIGPRDMETDAVFAARRDRAPKDKQSIGRADQAANVAALLADFQQGRFERARLPRG